MKTALRALLDGVIDYAGLFPPARLPLEQAARNYSAYVGGEGAWMLRHFVLPADQLAKLTAQASVSSATERWSLSALGSRRAENSAWRAALTSDLQQISEILGESQTLVKVASLELALPDDVDVYTVSDSMEHALQRILDFGLFVEEVFFEIPPSTTAPAIRVAAAEQIAKLNLGSLAPGLKLRTGGLEASAFPSPEELAIFIVLCQEHRLRWKATAGLHHALPHCDAEISVTTHGFLNVLVAVVMASAYNLNVEPIIDILNEQDAAAFSFTDQALTWHGREANVAQIQQARQRFISFGSCSFDEPRGELAAAIGCASADARDSLDTGPMT